MYGKDYRKKYLGADRPPARGGHLMPLTQAHGPGPGLSHKLRESWRRRQAYVGGNKLEAFRLASKEDLGIPVAVDVYGAKLSNNLLTGGQAVLQVYQEVLPAGMLEGLRTVLQEDFGLEGFFEKRRFKTKETLDAGGDLQETPVEMTIKEFGHQFIVNLNNYLDTGIFLDHRETRRRVEREVRNLLQMHLQLDDADPGKSRKSGPTVLNLFAYTGSFSVYAAAGGAEMTHSVDLSKTYCDWARRNLTLNGFPEDHHWIYRMDVFEFYKYAARKKMQFDLIIIDPPTFSRSKELNFSVQRDHARLLTGAGALLKAGGQIIFSNNCLEFHLDKKLQDIFRIQDIQNETIPLDFWVDTINPGWYDNIHQIHNCWLISKK